ncbi:MAG: 3-carboxy-cis,cis-muconate cycloisomerase [Candidatus Acidiferrales bacterium]
MTNQPTTRLLDPLFTTEAMREVFSDRSTLQGMLDFEAALARALVATGQAPAGVLTAIEKACQADAYDTAGIAVDAALSGNLAIPLLKQLTASVERAEKNASRFVHFGATSQDAIDTGRVLQIREALILLDANLAKISDRLAALTQEHSATQLAGRTWLQQASPISLGLKFAGWLDAIERHRERLGQLRTRALALQFGGSVGTLAVLGAAGTKVAAALAQQLRLTLPPISWHAHRDRFAEVAATIGLIVGTAGKIARDISLLSQTEVSEAFEPAAKGRGGSSTMPQKRNPVGSAVILSAATRVPPLVSTMIAAIVQEHERGLGGWQAEWETLPEIFLVASGALYHLDVILEGLTVDKAQMTANLSVQSGLALTEAFAVALAKHEGREPARKIAQTLARVATESHQPLREVVLKDPQMQKYFSAADVERIFNPKNFNGSAEAIVANVLAARASSKSGEGKSRT